MLIEQPADKYTTLRAGDEGTLTSYDPKTSMCEVEWDNGSRLPVDISIVAERPRELLN